MKLEWLRCFAQIASSGSLNKAAENLYMTQPALTKIIQQLEKETGELLLYRTKSGVTLTRQGEVFQKFACNVLNEYQSYLAEKVQYQQQEQNFEGAIELVISSVLLQTYYEDIETGMKKVFPKLNIHFIEAEVETGIQLILKNMRSLGFICYDHHNLLMNWNSSRLIHTELYRSELVFCTAKNSKHMHYDAIQKEQILAENIINMEFSKKSYSGNEQEICNIRTINLALIREILINNPNTYVAVPQCIARKKFSSLDILQKPYAPTTMVTFSCIVNQKAIETAI